MQKEGRNQACSLQTLTLKDQPGLDLLNPVPSCSRALAAGGTARSPKSQHEAQATALHP